MFRHLPNGRYRRIDKCRVDAGNPLFADCSLRQQATDARLQMFRLAHDVRCIAEQAVGYRCEMPQCGIAPGVSEPVAVRAGIDPTQGRQPRGNRPMPHDRP